MKRELLVASPGGVKLTRSWRTEDDEEAERRRLALQSRPGCATGRLGRPVEGFSPKARRQMRWVWNALPWEVAGRLVMITLTYPADWRRFCPDAATLKRQLRAFRERWRRRWGAPHGVWVLEFQPRTRAAPERRLAPHWHLYVGLPEAVSVDDYEGFRHRQRLAYRLVEEHGLYEGRRRVPAIGGKHGGEFGEWLLRSWSEVIGSASSDRAHCKRGVDVRPAFVTDEAAAHVRRVGDYLWRESGKAAQKEGPEGFAGLKWWDVWGLEPVEVEREVTAAEFVQMRRVLRRAREQAWGFKVKAAGVPQTSELRRDGIAVTNLRDGLLFAERLCTWAGAGEGTSLGADGEGA